MNLKAPLPLSRLFPLLILALSFTSLARGSGAFITGQTLGTLRNNYTGFVGFKFTTGNSAIKITQLGRWVVSGNTGSHAIKITLASSGSMVSGGTATVATSGAAAGQYVYATLPSPIILQPNTAYYVSSLETSGGDQWYDSNTTLTSTFDAAINNAVNAANGSTSWTMTGSAGNSFGPVNFIYAIAVNTADMPFTTGQTLGTPRNDYTGYVGFKFTVGSSPLTVKSLGRWVVTGNSGSHSMKVTLASTGSVVSGGTATVNTSGVPAGQFAYADLAAPIVLSANTAYYVSSLETSGGDQWYNSDTIITHSSSATVNGAVNAANGSTSWTLTSGTDIAFGPASFIFSTETDSGGGVFITGQTLGTLRNNYSGYVGMKFTVGNTPITISQIGRWVVGGNSGSHAMKISLASSGSMVTGGSATVATSGVGAGQFAYASLATPVVLSANTSYYVSSLESSGGDQWYDHDTVVAHTADATVDGAVNAANGSTSWTLSGASDNGFGPVNFITVGPPVTDEPQMFGVNLSGAEFNKSVLPGVYGTNYIYPNDSELAYYQSKGLTLIRLPFLWERMQPTLNAALNSAELARMDAFVALVHARGMKVILDMHDYDHYTLSGTSYLVGSTQVPYSAFQDVWSRLASHYASETAIYGYDIMNEPEGTGNTWYLAAQYGVNGVRQGDTTHYILVEGDNWAHASSWATSNPNLSISDSTGKIIYEAHCYFDSDSSGTYAKTYDQELAANPNLPAIGVTRTQPFVGWLQAHSAMGMIGEYGVPSGQDARWNTVLSNFLTYIDSVGLSGTYWAGGPWWGTYILSCEPTNNFTTDAPQMSVLQQFHQ